MPEVGDYVIEQQGRDKKAEGAGWFLRFIRERRPHGRIFLRFGAPLTLTDVVDEADIDRRPRGRRATVGGAEDRLRDGRRMNDATPITRDGSSSP